MIRVGIVGLGAMGRIHVRNLEKLSGRVIITSVFDPSPSACGEVALQTGARPASEAMSVVSDSEVDAILVASPADFHSELVLASVAVRKPVFCEKPLVVNSDQHSALATLLGTPGEELVWAGFMRRYDPAFMKLKQELAEGAIGQPVFIESSHRNPSVPSTFGNDAYMNETFIHEFDVIRWLTQENIVAIQVDALAPQHRGHLVNDPQFLTVWTESGIVGRITGHIVNGYGYDIRCEVVGSRGSASLETGKALDEPSQGGGVVVSASWGERFATAYQAIVKAWVEDLESGQHTGVGLREALSASAIAVTGIRAYESNGRPVNVQ